MTELFRNCEFTDPQKARAFVKRHNVSCVSDCVDIIVATRKNLDPIKETFLIGLNGFPNRKKGELSDGNVAVFNWTMRQAQAEGLSSSDYARVSAIASENCRILRVSGDPYRLVRSVLGCLRNNEDACGMLQEEIGKRERNGISVIDAGKFYGLRKSIRQSANSSLRRKSDTEYTVRKYADVLLLEDYLESLGPDRRVYVSENGNLCADELKNFEFWHPLLWIIRSSRFQDMKMPHRAPFYVYEAKGQSS